MIRSEFRRLAVLGYCVTEFSHDYRFPAVPCGGRIVVYRVYGAAPSAPWALGHCVKCKQTAVWDGELLPMTLLEPV